VNRRLVVTDFGLLHCKIKRGEEKTPP